jgi:hypothetical protein
MPYSRKRTGPLTWLELMARIPMLKRWLERGKEKRGEKEDSFAAS